MFDKNASGTIDLNEFQQLFNYINQWKGVFQSFDKDRSGKIEQQELMQGNSESLARLELGECAVFVRERCFFPEGAVMLCCLQSLKAGV